jgi:hypothetical protein
MAKADRTLAAGQQTGDPGTTAETATELPSGEQPTTVLPAVPAEPPVGPPPAEVVGQPAPQHDVPQGYPQQQVPPQPYPAQPYPPQQQYPQQQYQQYPQQSWRPQLPTYGAWRQS